MVRLQLRSIAKLNHFPATEKKYLHQVPSLVEYRKLLLQKSVSNSMKKKYFKDIIEKKFTLEPHNDNASCIERLTKNQ